MRTAFFIATRYLQSNRENRFFSWITVLSVAGVAIGVAAMTVVLSVINGFEKELKNRFLAANAHVLAFNFPGGLEQPSEWAKKIEGDFGNDLTGLSRFVHYETMARKNSLLHPTLIRGIEPLKRQHVQDLRPLVNPPTALETLEAEITGLSKNPRRTFGKSAGVDSIAPIILGRGLLSLLDAKVGDVVQLIAPDPDRVGEMQSFRVVGVYDSGLKHYDNKLGIVSLPTAQKFFQMGTRVTGLEIGLKKPNRSMEIAESMREKYTIQIKEWQSFNRSMFEAMQIERAVIAAIVFLVSGVAGFNILTTLFISVTQKQKSISILKALGANNREIMTLFLIQGAWVGILGTGIGCLLAVVISKILEKYQFIDLPDLYMLATLPLDYNWRTYAAVASGALIVSVFAGVYPSWVASRVPPIAGMKGIGSSASQSS